MSVGKFFILAILLPMATIYFTLALKGQSDTVDVIEAEVEHQPYVETEVVDVNEVNSDIEEPEYSLNDEPDDADDSLDSEDSFSSIEEMINFKKNKNDDLDNETLVETEEIIEPEKNSFSNADVDKVQKSVTSAIVIKQQPQNKVTVSKKSISAKTAPKSTTKLSSKNKPKRVSKKNIKVKTPRVVKNKKTIIKPKPVLVFKPKAKPIRKSIPKLKQTVKARPKVAKKSQNTFKKQSISKSSPRPATKAAVTNFSAPNFNDLFDDDIDEDDEDIVLTEQDSQESTVIADELPTDAEKKRFSTDPCSGRSARYIARCRK